VLYWSSLVVASKDFKWTSIDAHQSTYFHFKDHFSQATLPVELGYAMGIDPGRNFGICTIRGREVNVTHGTFEKADWVHYAKWAAEYMRNTFHWCVDWPVTIEGASYNDVYGQVGLAYIRMGFYLPMSRVARVEIVPPATVRKVAFGYGKTKAKDIWHDINPNGAAAVGCALHALGVTIDVPEDIV
jgi:hypothetical protein